MYNLLVMDKHLLFTGIVQTLETLSHILSLCVPLAFTLKSV